MKRGKILYIQEKSIMKDQNQRLETEKKEQLGF